MYNSMCVTNKILYPSKTCNKCNQKNTKMEPEVEEELWKTQKHLEKITVGRNEETRIRLEGIGETSSK